MRQRFVRLAVKVDARDSVLHDRMASVDLDFMEDMGSSELRP